MLEKKNKYIENTKEAMRLMKLCTGRAETEEALLRQIRASAEQVYRLRKENDHIINDEILAAAPEELTKEDCEALFELAQECFHFKNSLDAGLSYRIHSLLYRAAKLRDDLPHMIQELYWQGICLYYVNVNITNLNLNPFGDQVTDYFCQASSYFDHYDELPSETRDYILRSMSNRTLYFPKLLPNDESHLSYTEEAGCAIYDQYMRLWSESMNIFCSPEYQKKNPEIPWDLRIYTRHFDRLAFFSLMRQIQIPRIAKDLMESAAYVYHRQALSAKTNDTAPAPRAVAYYYMGQYHTEQISGDQLIEQLLKLHHDSFDSTRHDASSNYINLQLPQFIDNYVEKGALSPEGEVRFREQLEKMRQQFREYLMNSPYSGYNSTLGLVLRNDMIRDNNYSNEEFRVRIMDSMLSFHTPTYIHSCMVAYITRELIARLLEVNPMAADGVLGISYRQLRLHRNVVCNVAWKCGMYHDVGKSMVMNYVVIYNRSLLDEEFQIIKLHPKLSYYLLQKIPGEEAIAEVALRHHRNYDGKSGYPLDCPPCPPELQVLADALTVADSMDAATDNVGRCYAAAKSYDDLVEELIKFRGTRYAPCIVDLFLDKDFRERMGKNLEEERKHTYWDVYSTLAEEQKNNK